MSSLVVYGPISPRSVSFPPSLDLSRFPRMSIARRSSFAPSYWIHDQLAAMSRQWEAQRAQLSRALSTPAADVPWTVTRETAPDGTNMVRRTRTVNGVDVTEIHPVFAAPRSEAQRNEDTETIDEGVGSSDGKIPKDDQAETSAPAEKETVATEAFTSVASEGADAETVDEESTRGRRRTRGFEIPADVEAKETETQVSIPESTVTEIADAKEVETQVSIPESTAETVDAKETETQASIPETTPEIVSVA